MSSNSCVAASAGWKGRCCRPRWLRPGSRPLLDGVLSVEEAGVFKPATAVYALVGTRFGIAPARTGFVSSNGWDACAAAAFGFHAIWVNREGAPMDRLHGRPAQELSDLRALPELAARLAGDDGGSPEALPA